MVVALLMQPIASQSHAHHTLASNAQMDSVLLTVLAVMLSLMPALRASLINVPMVSVSAISVAATTTPRTSLALLELLSALMDLALQMVNAHSPTAALLALHSNVPLVNVSTLRLEIAQSASAQLTLQLSASMVSAPRATSSVLPPSLMLTPRPAPMN
jgi:hypothetical protein